ncbi:nuclear transport factor 2 family protein [Parasulfuritortus cantonensis]|uniref:Nuclear transport factor 2 family protein n=1 Tax=Parasulfuritortus cantonensis TaxID=2528202 RepID=A0A4R1BCX5_9PROT|nr:nuclear transport factor 2 family protein [Parasulfuritortus cantonensis]TCJ14909.1 nuclear transport factor 2 family protein [Parasulfuritortus cantonensis]
MDTPAALADRIARLEDIEAIRAMVATYALGADRNNDPAILGPLFADDAEWVCEGFGHYRGRREIADELARIGREAIRWSLHYMVSPLVEVAPDGRSARCHWYLWELARVADGEANWIGGWYESTLSKAAGSWSFSHVRLHLKLMSPHAEGWKTLPSAN